MKRWILPIAVAIACGGCTADLKRVHTPDLLTVTEKESRKWSGADDELVGVSSIPDRASWQIYSTLQPLDAMHDGKPTTAAFALMPESKDQYVLVDLGETTTVRQVVQIHPNVEGRPLRYRIDAAGNHNFPYALKFVGKGKSEKSVATFKRPIQCRFLRITLLETNSSPWAISDLRVY